MSSPNRMYDKGSKMRKGWLIVVSLALVLALLGTMGCSASTHRESNFNLIFRYGVMSRNELNTFEGTYTKDMIMDPSITVNLPLSQEELDRIYQKMVEIDFFSYPDVFSVSVTPPELIGIVIPHLSYYFKVEYDSKIKELWWEDEITNEDEKAEKLRELIRLIKAIVESKEECEKLQPPTGGYL